MLFCSRRVAKRLVLNSSSAFCCTTCFAPRFLTPVFHCCCRSLLDDLFLKKIPRIVPFGVHSVHSSRLCLQKPCVRTTQTQTLAEIMVVSYYSNTIIFITYLLLWFIASRTTTIILGSGAVRGIFSRVSSNTDGTRLHSPLVDVCGGRYP